MGRKTPGIAPEPNGSWSVDKVWRGRRLRRRGFVDHEEAQGWLIAQLQALRAQVLHGAPRAVSFEAAVTRYLTAHYSLAQLVELHEALTKIEQPATGWNKSLHTLRQEARSRLSSHPKVTQATPRVA